MAVLDSYIIIRRLEQAGRHTVLGFSTEPAALLWLPGPFERRRFLSLELTPGALAGACGLVAATGAFETPTSGLAASRPGAARFHYAG